jgi:hypothetical protein
MMMKDRGEDNMTGHRPWKEIRGAVNRGPAHRRRVEAACREAEDEQATSDKTANPAPDTEGTDAANDESLASASPHP